VGDVSAVLSRESAEPAAGHGDLGDLAELVSWVGADLGGDFVLAATPGADWAPWTTPRRVRASDLPDATRAPLAERDGGPEGALRAVYAVSRSPRHRRAYETYCERGGQRLVDVATWLVLAARHGGDPAAWRMPLRDAGSEDVAHAREHAAEEVDFHRWCQWAADRQLSEASREAAAVGMRVGVLAPLVAPGAATGALAWLYQISAVSGVQLGEPPSEEQPRGSVNGHRPWRPGIVSELGAGPLFDQLEVARHSGGLLLDRPVSWFRQWWVPEGADPAAGTWVRQDHETLLAAVGIAAHRQGAVVLADLGELAPHESRWLRAHGVVPLALDNAQAPDSGGAAVRGVTISTLAGAGPWTIEGLAASARARRVARGLG
jgi:4-alpha-glucanotransferase